MMLCTDSRKVQPGDTFFCIKGTTKDGHDYAGIAADKGASTIIYQNKLSGPKRDGVDYIHVDDTLKALNDACNIFFDYPSRKLKIFGITGTNGKTTTANIISQVFSGRELCGYIGTVNTHLGSKVIAPSLTTPDPITLNSILKSMCDDGAKAAVLEVSAHGLSQGRVDAVDFDYAVFTNFTHDHLDYYGTMANYFKAKTLLFRNLKPEARAILNSDSDTLASLKSCCECSVVTYGIDSEADYRATDIDFHTGSTDFNIRYKGNKYAVTTNLTAKYNVYNLISAAAAMHEAGMPLEEIASGFSTIDQIPGRQQEIREGQNYDVIVDYAHTPDGYEQLLSFLRQVLDIKKRKLITVCGAPGGRDHTKRRDLAAISEKYSDNVVITTYDPRDEEPSDIVAQLHEGITDDSRCECFADRTDAISAAISHADEGDCVVILGKGVEDFMHTRDGKVPYAGDDKIARDLILKRKN